MRVVRVVGYHKDLQMEEAPEPEISSPLDVIVKIGAAGVCRTDLHILEGQWGESRRRLSRAVPDAPLAAQRNKR